MTIPSLSSPSYPDCLDWSQDNWIAVTTPKVLQLYEPFKNESVYIKPEDLGLPQDTTFRSAKWTCCLRNPISNRYVAIITTEMKMFIIGPTGVLTDKWSVLVDFSAFVKESYPTLTDSISSASFCPDYICHFGFLAVGHMDGTISFWRANRFFSTVGFTLLHTESIGHKVQLLSWSYPDADCSYLAASTSNGKMKIFQMSKFEAPEFSAYDLPPVSNDPRTLITVLQWRNSVDKSTRLLSVGKGNSLFVFAWNGGKPTVYACYTFPDLSPIAGVCWDIDLKNVVVFRMSPVASTLTLNGSQLSISEGGSMWLTRQMAEWKDYVNHKKNSSGTTNKEDDEDGEEVAESKQSGPNQIYFYGATNSVEGLYMAVFYATRSVRDKRTGYISLVKLNPVKQNFDSAVKSTFNNMASSFYPNYDLVQYFKDDATNSQFKKELVSKLQEPFDPKRLEQCVTDFLPTITNSEYPILATLKMACQCWSLVQQKFFIQSRLSFPFDGSAHVRSVMIPFLLEFTLKVSLDEEYNQEMEICNQWLPQKNDKKEDKKKEKQVDESKSKRHKSSITVSKERLAEKAKMVIQLLGCYIVNDSVTFVHADEGIEWLKNNVEDLPKEWHEIIKNLTLDNMASTILPLCSSPCPACSEPIAFQSTNSATCPKGHHWDRCGITCLPIFSASYLRCTTCHVPFQPINQQDTSVLGRVLTAFLLKCPYCFSNLERLTI